MTGNRRDDGLNLESITTPIIPIYMFAAFACNFLYDFDKTKTL